LRNELGWGWQLIGAELGITKQGTLKVHAEHVQDSARRNTATDRARFEAVRPSAPVASPAVDVPLDLDWTPSQRLSRDDQPMQNRGIQTT